MIEFYHYGDPCVHCGTPHDDVLPGLCLGDPTKAVPIAFRSLGVRWDNVERFFVQMSDGRVEERYYHISEWADYHNFEGCTTRQPGALRYDETLTFHTVTRPHKCPRCDEPNPEHLDYDGCRDPDCPEQEQ